MIFGHNYYPEYRGQPFHHTDPRTDALRMVLDAAYHEMIGQDEVWPVDPNYEYTLRPQWGTREGREQLITAMDSEFMDELQLHKTHWNNRNITKIPEFYRLTEPQRVAFCQQLHAVLLQYEAVPV